MVGTPNLMKDSSRSQPTLNNSLVGKTNQRCQRRSFEIIQCLRARKRT